MHIQLSTVSAPDSVNLLNRNAKDDSTQDFHIPRRDGRAHCAPAPCADLSAEHTTSSVPFVKYISSLFVHSQGGCRRVAPMSSV